MTTIEILNENLVLNKTKFNTFYDFIEEIEDLKFWEIMSKNKEKSYDISFLKKKYLW